MVVIHSHEASTIEKKDLFVLVVAVSYIERKYPLQGQHGVYSIQNRRHRWIRLRDHRQVARLPRTSMTNTWDDVSFVTSSQYRVAVLQYLSEEPATPTLIATETDFGIPHISKAFQNLRERDLVELLVSEDKRKGRVYGITEQGTDVLTQIEEEDLADSIMPSE